MHVRARARLSAAPLLRYSIGSVERVRVRNDDVCGGIVCLFHVSTVVVYVVWSSMFRFHEAEGWGLNRSTP
jgi:hypothetical protein